MRIFGRTKRQHHEDGGSVATMDPADAVVTVPPKTELDKVQDEINLINSERSRLEGQARGHCELIAAIDHEAAGLKQKLVAGDATMGAALDALDVRRVDSVRKVEGIVQANANLEMRIMPLQTRARNLAAEADRARQDQAVQDLQNAAEKLSRRIISHWREACADAFELTTAIDDAIDGRGLDPEHRQAMLAAGEKLYAYFIAESLRVVNEGWTQHRTHGHLFQRLLIQPAKPKSK